MLDPNYMALADVLFGYALSRTTELGTKNLKLAHYTSAENALNIINGETMWLRNAGVMNDHSEIEHGRGILHAPWSCRRWAGGCILSSIARTQGWRNGSPAT